MRLVRVIVYCQRQESALAEVLPKVEEYFLSDHCLLEPVEGRRKQLQNLVIRVEPVPQVAHRDKRVRPPPFVHRRAHSRVKPCALLLVEHWESILSLLLWPYDYLLAYQSLEAHSWLAVLERRKLRIWHKVGLREAKRVDDFGKRIFHVFLENFPLFFR